MMVLAATPAANSVHEAPREQHSSEDYVPLSDAQLRKRFANVVMTQKPSYDGETRVSLSRGERFYRRGRYVRMDHRFDQHGKFEIAGGQLCVTLASDRHCDTIYAGPDNTLFLKIDGTRYWPIDLKPMRK